MSTKLKVLLAGAVMALLAACAGLPVSVDYDPAANFSTLQRYAWVPITTEARSMLRNDLMDARVRRAVNEQLAARGMALVDDPAQADFLVNWYAESQEKIDIDTFYSNFGYYPCWHCYGPYGYGGYGYPGWGNEVRVRQYTEGSLMLDMVRPDDKRLFWRGVVSRRLPNFKTPQERDLYITELVSALLAKFPPGSQAAR